MVRRTEDQDINVALPQRVFVSHSRFASAIGGPNSGSRMMSLGPTHSFRGGAPGKVLIDDQLIDTPFGDPVFPTQLPVAGR